MRKLVLFMHVSLDGYASDSNGGLDWIPYNEEMEKYAEEVVAEVGSPVYGRTTYRMMESHWPMVLDHPNASMHDREHAKWVQDVKKIVISGTMDKAEWNNTMLIKDNIAEQIKALKEEPGKNLVIFGSPGAAKTLLELGLIDELLLTICPVVLGGGTSVFHGGVEKIRLKLQSSRTFKSGIIATRYELEK
ncbi:MULTISPECIES: dihydrofolate reductase family protein [unclassified Paenibacillus]|uniref:dihydrofolate reductase family protein n=1 Tax=unclassified Paenibacillus TaxID=185978 RepID=UPI0009564AA7|nr:MULTISPECIES: dihydrofolate reductase family protein [unclassified Paenibacillus]ASS67579.1 dihydrofolate reductase family protein [Paenibacillus sp. RUD330]SIQ72036.1 Dihydrofolate reductase [Paenibacillus sp. RU4X]SIQ93622.1 Dihydrofolate reductase [Paenibacillus sp. RU4T]